jgi:hypothetical protein
MKIKIKIFDEKEGYSIDVLTWRSRLLRQKRCASLMEVSDFLTDVINLTDAGVQEIVDWFAEEECAHEPGSLTPASRVYEIFSSWCHQKEILGGREISQTAFGRAFSVHFDKEKINGVITYLNVAFKGDWI